MNEFIKRVGEKDKMQILHKMVVISALENARLLRTSTHNVTM